MWLDFMPNIVNYLCFEQTDSVKDHIERISKLNESPSKSRITAKKYQTPGIERL